MRALVQRVSQAQVAVEGEVVGCIGAGLMILVGVTHADTAKDVDFLVRKCAGLRIFEDAEGLMNVSLQELGLEILAISQFTLYGDASHGRRPSFTMAARPEQAQPLYEAFVAGLRQAGIRVATGIFGADMKVTLCNDGPVTLLVESGS